MAITWTKEKLALLTASDLENVKNNISKFNNLDQIELVNSEILRRVPPAKIPPNAPEGFEPIVRSALTKKLELDAADMLEKLAKDLFKTYDFSRETAESISEGIKGFEYITLLNKKNKAKPGGLNMRGLVAFERYISFNLKEHMYGLDAVLVQGGNQRNVMYLVIGPKSLLENAISLDQVNSLFGLDKEKDKIRDCEEFNNFEEAAERFKWLIDQVVPKLKK